MRFRFIPAFFAAVAVATLLLVPADASASISYTTSGTNPGDSGSTPLFGQAIFTVTSGTRLTVQLTNTSGSPTTSQGATLTGLVFNIPGSAFFSSIGLTSSNDHTWTSLSAFNDATPLTGSWTDALQVTSLGSSAVNVGVGIATTGKNIFNGGSISVGNASPDYGIVAANSFPAASFGGSKFPFIQDSLTFKFNLSQSITESQIDNVFFLFGTNDNGGVLPGTPGGPPPVGAVPEPASIAVWGIVSGLAAGAVSLRKRRGRWSEKNRSAIYKVVSGKTAV